MARKWVSWLENDFYFQHKHENGKINILIGTGTSVRALKQNKAG